MTKDICVIKNPGSGKREGRDEVEALEGHFAEHPGRFELRVVDQGSDLAAAARQASREGFATVAAAGGDGTVCAVASALVGTQTQLGVLPLGTFNYFARTLDLPEDLGEAVAVLADGTPRPIDIGFVNGRAFLNNASLGLYSTMLQERERVYRRWGRSRLVAYGAVLTTLLGVRKPLALKVTVDGAAARVRTPMVFVAKNARQLEQVGVDGAEGIRDGQFAVFIAPDCGRWDLLRYAVRLAFRAMEPGRDFELMHGREVLVETSRSRLHVACDGERESLAAPFRFELRRDALHVLVPPSEA